MTEKLRTDNDRIVPRLLELVRAITGPRTNENEFSMRVPAEPNRDADIVLSCATYRIEELELAQNEIREIIRQTKPKRWLGDIAKILENCK